MVIGIPRSFAAQYIDFPLRIYKAMFTFVRFCFPFPFQPVFPLSFQFSSKRMPQTQAIAAHIHASHTFSFIFLFPFNLLFLLPLNFYQSACLRHKQYLSTFTHYVLQLRSIPMTYASLMSPLMLWHMPLMNIKLHECGHQLCTRLCYDACLRWM